MRNRSGSLRPAATGVLLLLLSGCVSGPPHAGTQALESPDAATTNEILTGPDTPAARKRFAAGLAEYCTTFYGDMLEADQKYPGPERSDVLAVDKASAAAMMRAQAMLHQLRPPPDLTETFSAFVASSQEINEARARLSTAHASGVDPADDAAAFQAALAERRPLAKTLGATRCDGELPPKQRAAAIALTRRVDLTSDPADACMRLVTPEYVESQWAGPNPMATCIFAAERGVGVPGARPTAISVGEVTGVDSLTATVHFVEVDGNCACLGKVARLHFIDGAWRLRSMSSEPPAPTPPGEPL